jgi:hypothetical protein
VGAVRGGGARAGGCESIFSFDGDPALCRRRPPPESLADERVIVRVIESPGPNERLLLARVRYLAPGANRYINRLVYATAEKVRPAGEGLAGVRQGDTLRVSATYNSRTKRAGCEADVSNWTANAGQCCNGAWVSLHTLDGVTRSSVGRRPGRGLR